MKKEMTPYLAVGIAEGFEESDSLETTLEAWAYIARTKMHISLQGFFGRQLQELVDDNIMDWDGNIDWSVVEELKEHYKK